MEELTRMREELGLSQQKLADESGVNKATINQIERGRRSPNIDTLVKLADAMGREVGEFFPKAQAPLWSDESPAGWRSPIEAVANAADVLARVANDSELEHERAYGVALAAQVLEDQLSIYLGELKTLAPLSHLEKSSISRAMNALESVTTQYELDAKLRQILSEAEAANRT